MHNLPVKTNSKWSKELEKISSFMPEIHRGIALHSKSNSQTMTSLMTLNMIDSGPYRIIQQILAQIHKKSEALRYHFFKLAKKELAVSDLKAKESLTAHEKLNLDKLISDIEAAQNPIENSIKEIGALQQRYKEVIKNKNLPENWDEQDFENAEIEHHIKSIFRNAIRDRLAKTCNMGTMEYMEQYGIEPILAYTLVDGFINKTCERIQNNEEISIETRYEFFDRVYEIFKNEYKKPMKRIGLDSIHYADFLTKTET